MSFASHSQITMVRFHDEFPTSILTPTVPTVCQTMYSEVAEIFTSTIVSVFYISVAPLYRMPSTRNSMYVRALLLVCMQWNMLRKTEMAFVVCLD